MSSAPLYSSDLRHLAEVRLEDAELLLRSRRYSGAYYLSGYFIECALKVCIAKNTRRFQFPPPPGTVRGYYTHDLEALVRAAGLSGSLTEQTASDDTFAVNWRIVNDWSESSRYAIVRRIDAVDMYQAVSDQSHGVFQWVKRHW